MLARLNQYRYIVIASFCESRYFLEREDDAVKDDLEVVTACVAKKRVELPLCVGPPPGEPQPSARRSHCGTRYVPVRGRGAPRRLVAG